MDSFVFPRPQAAVPRQPVAAPRPKQPSSDEGEAHNRDSNALRASVLDVALELGIGNNATVTNWMFNNSIGEEDEEEAQTSPGLTSGSTATSDSSHASGDVIYSTPRTPPSQHNYPYPSAYGAGAYMTVSKPILPSENTDQSMWSAGSQNTITIPEPQPPNPPAPASRNKLKKKRADGYESDGGYVSEGGRKRKERAKEEKKRAKEEQKLVERTRKKSGMAKDAPSLEDLRKSGYETDGAVSKSKAKKATRKAASGDNGYETDDGYTSSSGKKKSKFFRRATKRSDATSEELPPRASIDPPSLPMPLPIAERFGTGSLEIASADLEPPPPLSSFGLVERSNSAPASVNHSFLDQDPVASYNDDMDSVSSHSHSQSGHSHSYSGHSRQQQAASAGTFSPKPSDENLSGRFGSSHSNISYPIGRSESPLSTASSVPVIQQAKHVPSPLSMGVNAGGYYQSPVSSAGLAPPISSGMPSSPRGFAIGSPSDQLQASPSGSPLNSSKHLQVDTGVSQSSRQQAHLSQLSIIPSTTYIVPSPLPSPASSNVLPSPNRLGSYDLPPPSPPPTAPLPVPPAHRQGGLSPIPSPLSRSASHERLDETTYRQPIQRGITSPFPSRPVTPNQQQATSPLSGFEARVKIPRYRDLYAMPSPVSGWGSQAQRGGQVRWKDEVEEIIDPGINIRVPSDDEDNEDAVAIRHTIIERFEAPDNGEDESAWQGESALERSHSFNLRQQRKEARRLGMEPSEFKEDSFGETPRVSEDYYRRPSQERRDLNRDSDGLAEYYASDSKDPNYDESRWSGWSGSVYSRNSFMDGERSEESHTKLVGMVETDFDRNGRPRELAQRGDWIVPPVPGLPNRFGPTQQTPRRQIGKF